MIGRSSLSGPASDGANCRDISRETRHARPQSEPLFASAHRRGGAGARARDRRDQHAARAHEHHVEQADAAARGRMLPHLRCRHPAHRRIDHALRAGRAAPVRGAGRVSAERERGHRPVARQAARPAAAGARRHRPAGDRLRARTAPRRGRDQGGRRHAVRHQAARGHAGHGRDPGRDRRPRPNPSSRPSAPPT